MEEVQNMLNNRKGTYRLGVKRLMRTLGVRLALLVVGTQGVFVAYGQSRESYFVHAETLQPVTYLIPDFAVLNDVSITYSQEECLISLVMDATLPTNPASRGRMTVEVWFRHNSSAPLHYDRAAVYVAGGIDYPSNPSLLPGNAGLVECDRNHPGRVVKLASIRVQVVGNQVRLRVPTRLLSGYVPLIAVVRYLPSHVNLDDVGGGFGMCDSSSQLLDNRLSGKSITLPPFPYSLGAAPSDRLSGGGGFGGNSYQDTRPYPFAIPPSRRGTPGRGVPIRIPDTSPPQNPERWPKPGDINGDGVADYDYPSDTSISGNITLDVWATDGDVNDYVLLLGEDTNQNGRLEPHEVWYPLGECPWPFGVNKGYVGTDGKVYWDSFNDTNRNRNWDPGEPKKTFIYIPQTGELVVLFDPDGPGGQSPREVYRGDPNGYLWHHRQ
jgi:hypothetical protein